ncbi:MAG: GIY-YIG nuclease family protein [Deltaproteobacteria bacterium]|nr:GIY-YIG nuclease family protein [Deltaproteobacteria bacterium]
MAGLLIRELKLRGLAERILIVGPSNLTFQWQRELKREVRRKVPGCERQQYPRPIRSQSVAGTKPGSYFPRFSKREDILPGLRQVHWDLVIVDEAHRMSWTPPSRKTARYGLGELLRDTADHVLLLTATPHKGDPVNFSLFLQLLDADAYADVRSIREAMNRRRAPFYLRRTKEAMVYFPERQPDLPAPRPNMFYVYAIECEGGRHYIGQTENLQRRWQDHITGKVEWTKRNKPVKIAHYEEYQSREEAVKREADLKTGFGRQWLKELIASGRARQARLPERGQAGGSWKARKIFTKRIPHTVDFQIDGAEFDLYRDVTRFVKMQSARAAAQEEDPRARAVGFLMSLYQRRLASSTYALRHSLENRAHRLEEALKTAQQLARMAPPDLPARALAGEAKLSRLKELLHKEGFFDHSDKRLLIFTEFKDTLDYLVDILKNWGFRVGFIHGGMKPGSRKEPKAGSMPSSSSKTALSFQVP